MKKILFPLIIVALFVGLFEQSKEHPNTFILIVVVAIFMFGIMKLSSKIPSKHEENQDEDDV